MIRCIFDIEANSKEPMNAEIIEAYFKITLDGAEIAHYHMKSQIDNWSEEAEKIHGISQAECFAYPDKIKALYGMDNFLKNLPEDTQFICFANPNVYGNFMHYDKAVIEMNFMLHGFNFKFPNITSVHTMAKEVESKKLFDAVRGESGRKSFTQENIYKALFDKDYEAHRAKFDVLALEEIYNELEEIRVSGKANKFKRQLKLI